MCVIGMDISKGIATCVMLEELPSNLLEFSRSEEFVYWHVKPCLEDLEAIATLEPKMIVYEPSGGKYERAFIQWFTKRGIECQKVAGRRLAIYRTEKGLPKDDHFDGLAIAAYGIEKNGVAGAFIPQTPPEIEHLRQLWLQRHSLNRQRSAMVARLRQQLAYEFPEAMEFDCVGKWGRDVPGLILWLNGDQSTKGYSIWENRYTAGTITRGGKKVEVPGTIGSGISDYTRMVAAQLLEAIRAIASQEEAIDSILNKAEYEPYIRAMRSLDFNRSMMAVWLSRIFPFDKFLDQGRERTSRRMSNSGKWCTHNQSLAQFKAALGAAIDIPRSGMTGIAPTRQKWRSGRKEKSEKVPIGCKYSRIAFWQWATLRIETSKAQGELAAQLIARRHQLKEKGKNLFQRSGNLHGYACKLLYRQLKKELLKSQAT